MTPSRALKTAVRTALANGSPGAGLLALQRLTGDRRVIEGAVGLADAGLARAPNDPVLQIARGHLEHALHKLAHPPRVIDAPPAWWV